MAKGANGKTGVSGRNSGGGGINTKQHVRVGVRAGPASTRVASPAAAANLGNKKGNHISGGGGQTTHPPAQPLYTGSRPQDPMGNDVARTVGRGGPGAGRVVSPTGSQGFHAGSGEAIGTRMLPQGKEAK
jgi:hypothetical protein